MEENLYRVRDTSTDRIVAEGEHETRTKAMHWAIDVTRGPFVDHWALESKDGATSFLEFGRDTLGQ